MPHDKLLHKLEAYGIREDLHKWVSSFLCSRKMKVVLDGVSSSETRVESGVPQGTVLGPLLFLCHINDLPLSVKSQVRLFADDCLLYHTISSAQDHQLLQNDLKALEEWASTWGMKFNAKNVISCLLGKSLPSTINLIIPSLKKCQTILTLELLFLMTLVGLPTLIMSVKKPAAL